MGPELQKKLGQEGWRVQNWNNSPQQEESGWTVSAAGYLSAPLLPAPTDFALGCGTSLLAAADGKQVVLKGQRVQPASGELQHLSPQAAGPSSSAHTSFQPEQWGLTYLW